MRSSVAALLASCALSLSACSGSQSPALGSIGVMARREPSSGRVVIVDVPPGLAGDHAGLRVGDEVIAVNGVSVLSMTTREFSHAVRGEIGSKVRITVLRDGKELDLEVVREALKTN